MELALFFVAAVLCLIGVGYCLLRTKYAFVSALLMFPAEQLLQSYNPELILRYNWLVNVVVAMVVAFAVMSAFFRKADMTRGMWNGVTISMYALFAYVLVATAWTPAPESAAFFLKAYLPYWIFFLVMCPMLLRRIDDYAHIVVPTMIAGIVLTGLLFISPRGHFQNGRYVVDLGYLIGYGELESNPLALADLGGSMVIMALLYRGYERNTAINVVRALAFAAGLLLTLASGSRGQVVFSLLCGLAFVPLLHDRRNWGQFITLGFSGVMGLALLFIFYRLLLDPSGVSRWSSEDINQGLEVRALMALDMIGIYVGDAKAWIFGLGTSAFNAYFPIREHSHWYPHNIFVEALSEYGLIGLGLLLVACYAAFHWSKVLFEFTRDDISMRSATVSLLSLTIFQMLLATKQGHMMGVPIVFTLMLVISKLAKTEIWEQAQAAAWGGGPEHEEWGEAEEAEYGGAFAPQAE